MNVIEISDTTARNWILFDGLGSGDDYGSSLVDGETLREFTDLTIVDCNIQQNGGNYLLNAVVIHKLIIVSWIQMISIYMRVDPPIFHHVLTITNNQNDNASFLSTEALIDVRTLVMYHCHLLRSVIIMLHNTLYLRVIRLVIQWH